MMESNFEGPSTWGRTQLRKTLLVSFSLFLLGTLVFLIARGLESALWFAFGGGLALVNFYLAMIAVSRGLENIKNASIFIGLILFKSLTFILLIAVILMFLKPQLLAFTLGIGVVIFGAVVSALIERRHLINEKKREIS